jgi:hypothetical protein
MMLWLASSTKVELWESLRQGFTKGVDSNTMMGFGVGLVAAAVVVVIIAKLLHRDRPERSRPLQDYLMLAVDLLGLSEDERRDLTVVAGAARLRQPVIMLLSPANLGRAVLKAGTRDPALHHRLDLLCQKMFDVPLTHALAAAIQRNQSAQT